jgi:hypothetical protein
VNGTTLPTSLIRYREALEDAVRRDLGRSRPRGRRGLVLRWALAAAVVAAAALGALSIISRDGAGASVVDRAAAAVAPSPGTILHVDMHGFQDNGDGTTITWRDESWQQQGPPHDGRQIATSPDGTITESGTTANRQEVYDAARNTIYVAAPEPPVTQDERNSYEILPGPKPGTAILRMPDREALKKGARVMATGVITTKQAKALKKGSGVLAWRFNASGPNKGPGRLTVIPRSSLPKPPPASEDSSNADPGSGDFRSQILALLRSGEARVVGHKAIDGQDTIEIASADGHTTYYVDPETYRPVELDTRGTTGGTALRFRTYETLDLAGNADLVSLTAQHPDARIDRDPAHFRAADERLYPHG